MMMRGADVASEGSNDALCAAGELAAVARSAAFGMSYASLYELFTVALHLHHLPAIQAQVQAPPAVGRSKQASPVQSVLEAAVARSAAQPELLKQLMAAYAAAVMQYHSSRSSALPQQHPRHHHQPLQQQQPGGPDLQHLFALLEEALSGSSTCRSTLHSSRDQRQAISRILQHFQQLCAQAERSGSCGGGGGSDGGSSAPQPAGGETEPWEPPAFAATWNVPQQALVPAAGAAEPPGCGSSSSSSSSFQQAYRELVQQEAGRQRLQAAEALLACCAGTPGILQYALSTAGKNLPGPAMLQLLCWCSLSAAAAQAGVRPVQLGDGSAAALEQLLQLRAQQQVGDGDTAVAQQLAQQLAGWCSGQHAQQAWEGVPPALLVAACALDAAVFDAVVGGLAQLGPGVLHGSRVLQQLLALLQQAPFRT